MICFRACELNWTSKASRRHQTKQVTAATMSTPSGFRSTAGASILVTGSSGLVGARLVEMLLARKVKLVRCFDVLPPSVVLLKRFQIASEGEKSVKGGIFEIVTGDLTDASLTEQACRGIDIVYHVAALVGPFHDRSRYMAVNYHGTLNVVEGCKKHGVRRLVFSSSPSTRFTGGDITGQKEDELYIPEKFLALYAESKAYAEKEVTAANDPPNLYTISVAPHQVYGPYDELFLPNLLETSGNGRLRIFGNGRNKISVCYVDNYCHGLMCGADALYENSPALSKFYIITDDEPQFFWNIINQACLSMGFTDLHQKFHLPLWLLIGLAHIANAIGWITGRKFKLNPFNVKMLTIHRYFSIENAKRDLKYEPIFAFQEAWASTIEWYRVNWLPVYNKTKKSGFVFSTTDDAKKVD